MRLRWSWGSAAVGAAAATAVTALLFGKPRDPTFHLISISISSFRLNLPLLDVELILTVHVTNPNIVPIVYSPTTMSIFYAGDLLGSAQILAGSQPPMSCQLLRLPTRIGGIKIAKHATTIVADAARREMVLDAAVDIAGNARMLWMARRFSVHVDSHVVVDPVFLDVVDQENKAETHLFS